MNCDNQPNKRDATRGGGVTDEVREEVEVKALLDNRREHMREAQNRSQRCLRSESGKGIVIVILTA